MLIRDNLKQKKTKQKKIPDICENQGRETPLPLLCCSHWPLLTCWCERVCARACVLCHKHFEFSRPVKDWDRGVYCSRVVRPSGTTLLLFVAAGSPGLPGSINTSLPSLTHWEETRAFPAGRPAQVHSSLSSKQHSQLKTDKRQRRSVFSPE